MSSERIYLPTPEQIEQACAAIQLGWSEEERARRKNGMLARSRGGEKVAAEATKLLELRLAKVRARQGA